MGKQIVKTISVEDVLNFQPELLNSKFPTVIKPVGFFQADELVAVALFSYPRSEELRRLYTAQLLDFSGNSDLDITAALSAMIRHYRTKHRPSDIFFGAGIADVLETVSDDLQLTRTEDGSLEWIDENRTHYTYKITASDSTKYYYGARTIEKRSASLADCAEDIYLGSGGLSSNNKFRNWKKKHSSTLQKEIVSIHSRKSEAYAREAELVGDLWRTDPNCLNSVEGGRAAYTKHNQNTHSYALLECEHHGKTLHSVKGKCLKCASQAVFSVMICDVHGEATHRSGICERCERAKRDGIKTCAVHGDTLHQGESCYRCGIVKSQSFKICATHGESLHSGDNCYKCSIQLAFSNNDCLVHGRTTFQGDSCTKCIADIRISQKHCSIHGLTTFQGDTCARCSASIALTTAVCEFHGEVSFTGDSCNTCRAESSVSQRECPIHGTVTHVGDKCRVCINQKAVNLKECERHGLVKHQGDRCSSCSSMETAHRRYHGNKPNLDRCHLCKESIV